MQKGGSKRKNEFSAVIESLMARFEESSNQYLQINSISAETGVEKRRLYDLLNVLVACGICVKTDTHTYRWNGLASFGRAMQQMCKDTEIRAITHDIDTLFILPESPAIGIMTSCFLSIFMHLGLDTIGIRDAALLMAPDEERSKPILRRLYLVAYLLEHAGLVKHAQKIGEYTITAVEIQSLAIQAITEIVNDGTYPPDRIETKLNRIDANFVGNLHEHRRDEFVRLLQSKSVSPEVDSSSISMTVIQGIPI